MLYIMDDNQKNKPVDAEEPLVSALDAATENSKDDGSARARLIEAATKLFAEHGLEGTSTRDIAKAADLNISLISYYFGGKEGLYKAVIIEFASLIKRQSEKIMEGFDVNNPTKESFQRSMRVLIKEMLPLKFKNRDIHSVLHREMMAGLPHAKEVYENIFSKVMEAIVGLYEAGQKKGFVRKDLEPFVVFFSLVHSVDMYFQMSHCQTSVQKKLLKIPEQMDEYSEQLYKIFVEGVLV